MAYLNNNGCQYTYFLFILLLIICFVKESRGGDIEHDYKDALTKSILFFEGQRSGKLPSDQRMDWRGNSGLSDGQTAGVNLSGGYYEAGDNVKFTFPMAFSMTMLSWSVIEFGRRMGNGDLRSALIAIRWGTDYLLKCARETPGTIFVAVGDHGCWERPEDMDRPRNVYGVTSGSDVAGEVVAALAAASIVFRKTGRDPSYGSLLLNTSKSVMQFELDNETSYYEGAYRDELLWGASWLYRATKSAVYRNCIVSFENTTDTDIFSWDSKFPGANVLLAREYLVGKKHPYYFKDFPQHVESFMCKILNYPSTNTTYTKGGLMMKLPDSPLESVTSVGFLIVVYAKYMGDDHVFQCGNYSFNSTHLQNQAQAQVDYILGTNPKAMSYMVGYRSSYPKRIHHRASSLPSIHKHPKKIRCAEAHRWLYTLSPNQNILTGAVVGGPDWNDSFEDDRSSFRHSEPATYINAPLVGILASLLP